MEPAPASLAARDQVVHTSVGIARPARKARTPFLEARSRVRRPVASFGDVPWSNLITMLFGLWVYAVGSTLLLMVARASVADQASCPTGLLGLVEPCPRPYAWVIAAPLFLIGAVLVQKAEAVPFGVSPVVAWGAGALVALGTTWAAIDHVRAGTSFVSEDPWVIMIPAAIGALLLVNPMRHVEILATRFGLVLLGAFASGITAASALWERLPT